MTTTDIFTGVGSDPRQDEQAQRAVKAGRKLQQTLTSYARILTKRNDVKVVMAARDNGSTDGKNIYWRPPLALGDSTPHVRALCDKRDDGLQLLCAACKRREEVLVVIYHEIAHICFDSFAPVQEQDKLSMIEDAIKVSGSRYAKRLEEHIAKAPYWTKTSYIGLAGQISEFLPIILNALEDARVNRELFKARKGTKVMFDSFAYRTFNEGVEQIDPATGKPKVILWRDYPLNMQAIIGVFCKASNYAYDGWFQPQVEEALNDKKLTQIINGIATARTAASVYALGFPVLERLRELGFCKLPEDPEPEPEEEQDDEPAPQPEGDSEDKSNDDSEESGDDEESGGSGEGSESDKASGDVGSTPVPTGSGEADGDEDEPDDPPSVGHGDSSGESERSDSADSEGDPSEAEDDSSDSGSDPGGDDADSGDLDDARSDADSQDTGTGHDGGITGTDASPDHVGTGDIDEAPVSPAGAEPPATDPAEPGTGDPTQDSGDEPTDQETGSDEADNSEGEEPIDTGADEGHGGVEVVENEANDDLPMGTPEDARKGLLKLGDHDKPRKVYEELAEKTAIDRAIIQGTYFETPSRTIWGVREHRYGQPIFDGPQNMSAGWDEGRLLSIGYTRGEVGVEGDFDPAESVLGPALLRMRVAFSDNKRGHDQRHLKGGKVDARVLGRRAWNDDERLFRKRIQPGKKSYFVLIGMDISGSTVGRNIALEKRAVMAQAELCSRMGVRFAIYGYSGNLHSPREGRGRGIDLDIYFIKEPNEPWTHAVQNRLREIGPDAANLDGHTLEYFRKVCDRQQETDKIILYYSDGKMPAENHDEELEILQREIKVCKQKGYVLLGVGIRTDSPIKHGLDTVQVDGDSDIAKVVRHLERKLAVRQ